MRKKSFSLVGASLLMLTISLNAGSSRIINGSTVSDDNNEWRFVASLQWRGDHYCGASFVSPRWLVTAGHCLSDEYGRVYTPQPSDTVAAGSYNLTRAQTYHVKRFIVHPNFDIYTLQNDIALVELDQPAEGVDFINYTVSSPLPTGTPTKATGWGTTSTTSTVLPDDLKEALLPIVDFDRCSQVYNGEVSGGMICAGYFTAVRDSCQGDSGGPLKLGNRLVGIVSWGAGCAQEGYPGVYTDVQHYQGWISQYVPSKVWVPVGIGDLMTVIPAFLSDTP